MVLDKCRICLSEHEIVEWLRRTGLLESVVSHRSVQHLFQEYEEHMIVRDVCFKLDKVAACLNETSKFNSYRLFFDKDGRPNKPVIEIVEKARKVFELITPIEQNNLIEKLAELPSLADSFEKYCVRNQKKNTPHVRQNALCSGRSEFNLYSAFFDQHGVLNGEVEPILATARRLRQIRSWFNSSDTWHLLHEQKSVKDLIRAYIQKRFASGNPVSPGSEFIDETGHVSHTQALTNRMDHLCSYDFPIYNIFFEHDSSKILHIWKIVEDVRTNHLMRFKKSRSKKVQNKSN